MVPILSCSLKILLLNQTFHPDVMATGQYLSELALRLAQGGHQVTVVTSGRAYDNPKLRFPKRETWRGIQIFRVTSTGFGKGAAWRRAADFASFIVACVFRLAFLPRHDRVVALTTPPLISFVAAWLARLWRAKFVYWVMDFNPDEAIASGWLRAGSVAARVLDSMSRFSLRQADKVIALDRFMRDRIIAKEAPASPRSGDSAERRPLPVSSKSTSEEIANEKIVVIPPWAHDDLVHYDAAGRDRFRRAHGLENKFVVMYSGNHSPVHPLDTLLAAADQLRHDPGIVFCFVGGGSEWRKLRERSVTPSPPRGEGGRRSDEVFPSEHCPLTSDLRPLPNALCLPYQPLDQLSASLSAADLQVVVMGDAMVGLVHPCKIYNILTVGAPVLYLGPQPSHVTRILERVGDRQLWGAARHGEVEKVVAHIQRIRQAKLQRTGKELAGIAAEFSRERGLGKMVGAICECEPWE